MNISPSQSKIISLHGKSKKTLSHWAAIPSLFKGLGFHLGLDYAIYFLCKNNKNPSYKGIYIVIKFAID